MFSKVCSSAGTHKIATTVLWMLSVILFAYSSTSLEVIKDAWDLAATEALAAS
jgi:hypothetical protein